MFTERIPRIGWRLLRLPPRLFYALGLGAVPGRLVLLLTTTGRKTGRRHVTPLQYEEENRLLYLISARGPQADWFQNILADPRVEVQVQSRRFIAIAQPVVDPASIARILCLRLLRHPRLVGTLLRADGLPERPTLVQLEQYATGLAMVIIPRPVAL
jgi:deazaflavin-dependent oxidoreductase (nitroreductase family)